MLTACGSIGYNLAELTGFSYLYDRRDSVAIETDEHIEDSATIALYRLGDVKKKSHITISSYNARVLITGEVENAEVLEKIIFNVRTISGVKSVYNELIIAPASSVQSRKEDSLLRVRVNDALAEIDNMPDFDAVHIKVISDNQIIYLMGLVHEEEAAIVAETIQKIDGVKKVVTVFEYIDYAKIKNK